MSETAGDANMYRIYYWNFIFVELLQFCGNTVRQQIANPTNNVNRALQRHLMSVGYAHCNG